MLENFLWGFQDCFSQFWFWLYLINNPLSENDLAPYAFWKRLGRYWENAVDYQDNTSWG